MNVMYVLNHVNFSYIFYETYEAIYPLNA